MKILKKVAWILLFFFVVLVVLVFVLPTDMHVQKAIEIEAPKKMVYNVINELKTHESWNPWKEQDQTMRYEYPEDTKGVGAYYDWTSENMGSGKYSIIESDEHRGIKSKVEFEGQGGGEGFLNIDGTEEETQVVWKFDYKLNRPSNLMGIFYKNGMKRSMKKGLKNLKEYLKARKEDKIYRNLKVNEIDMPDRHFVINRQEVPLENIQQFYAANLGALFGKVQRAGGEMVGMPCGLFFSWDLENKKSDMAAAIPIKKKMKIRNTQSFYLSERKALQIEYFGDYAGIAEAHEAIAEYMSDYSLLQDPPMIEEYITDPAEEPDPAKWLTKVTYYYTK